MGYEPYYTKEAREARERKEQEERIENVISSIVIGSVIACTLIAFFPLGILMLLLELIRREE